MFAWSRKCRIKPASERPRVATDKSQQGDAPIRIVQYDAAWLGFFENDRAIHETLLAQWLVGPIEHVGSTAVPGLAAKPVIDIMAGVKSLDESRPSIPTLATIGYVYFPYHVTILCERQKFTV